MQLERRTLAAQVYEGLRRAIMEDELPPGHELNEVALAARYEVSRGPVREALNRLAAEGLVTVRPRRGAVVTTLNKKDFLDAYQVREALEVAAVRIAVPRLDEDDHSHLRQLVDAMDKATSAADMEAFFDANLEFHGYFVQRSDNAKLRAIHAQVTDTMGRFRRRSLRFRPNITELLEEHAAILRAAEEGDAERAAELTSRHIRSPLDAVGTLTEAELSQPMTAEAGFHDRMGSI